MDKTEALKAIRTLVKSALETDDADLIQKHLKMVEVILEKALPGRKPVKK